METNLPPTRRQKRYGKTVRFPSITILGDLLAEIREYTDRHKISMVEFVEKAARMLLDSETN